VGGACQGVKSLFLDLLRWVVVKCLNFLAKKSVMFFRSFFLVA